MINIYQNTSATGYTLIYSMDHCNNFEVKKSTGIIPFSLPIVNQTSETSGRMITEQTEFIHIGGVEANVSIDFDIGMGNINTMLGLVSNKLSKKHKIDVVDWAGQSSGYTFIGIIDSVRIKQEGGDPRLTCNLTFLEGSNSLDDMDGL
jgi:hypothetical protein